MPTPKHSLLAKTIIWYLNGTKSQATSMQVSLKSRTLYNLPNPHQSNDWCDVTKRTQKLILKFEFFIHFVCLLFIEYLKRGSGEIR